MQLWDLDKKTILKELMKFGKLVGAYDNEAVVYSDQQGWQFIDVMDEDHKVIKKATIPKRLDGVSIKKNNRLAIIMGDANNARMLVDLLTDQVVYEKKLAGSSNPTDEEAPDTFVEVPNDYQKMYVVKKSKIYVYDISRLKLASDNIDKLK